MNPSTADATAINTARFWLKSYPPGVAHDIDLTPYRSLGQMFDESFRKHAGQRFSVCMDQWMSYGQLDEHSVAMGAWLQAQGLEPGTRVALMLPNVPQFPVSMAGVLRAGFTCVNVNPLYTARELEHQLKDSGASVIIILENFAHTLAQVIERTTIKHVVMASMGDLLGPVYGRWLTFAVRHLAKMVPAYKLPLTSELKVTPFSRALADGAHRTMKAGDANLDSVAFLQYTGGTTGLSKGAVLTHRNVIAAMLQSEAWFSPAIARVGSPSDMNLIAALPLYHIFALNLCVLTVRLGAFMTLIPTVPHAAGGEHPVQRALGTPPFQVSRFLGIGRFTSRWHGGLCGHRDTVVQDHRLPHDRRLGYERNGGDWYQQPCHQHRVHRQHWFAAAGD
jgi:long-chain acyl-CoA synthetase